MKKTLILATLLGPCALAHADAVDKLRDFVREVKTGKATDRKSVV